ncbi:3-hydroxyisobutyryl-CoA hydrolase, mitochondrial [Grifola frondosa]|uniref:3-hydroxyisobutyryl-CoA hydrolase n=1 Tax=Grifola frondosa TaxID=5627 RepID=A0A1C7LYE0_GRIFR|nr:3-hydroxyisobutyryl-CoA hydrolase, mitochondrial [Grifola frondosa]
MLATSVRVCRMSRPGTLAAQRTAAITRHMMSTSSSARSSASGPGPASDEAPVLFESKGPVRSYILNRPLKLNALNEPMLNILRPKIEEWCQGKLAKVIVGRGVGRAFCAGEMLKDPETRSKAIDFFHREFEMDYILAAVPKPYICFMDGITMGGGVGLSVNAQFRIATENTVFAMPETKIGYCPDVGASYFLSRIDGEIGTYLALTGEIIRGRAVFEHGLATHFIPSRRIPALLESLASLDDPTYSQIDELIEECRSEREPEEPVTAFVGATRVALDSAFQHNTVEKIVGELQTVSTSSEHEEVRKWAKQTLAALELRSPTSLKVALAAIRRGKGRSLLDALQMEMNIAAAYCHGESPDFLTGVSAVLVDKIKTRPAWSPDKLEDVNDSEVLKKFFSTYTPAEGNAPTITPPDYLGDRNELVDPMQYALPTEDEIRKMVDGSHLRSGATEITLEELVAKFEDMRRGSTECERKFWRLFSANVSLRTTSTWIRSG